MPNNRSNIGRDPRPPQQPGGVIPEWLYNILPNLFAGGAGYNQVPPGRGNPQAPQWSAQQGYNPPGRGNPQLPPWAMQQGYNPAGRAYPQAPQWAMQSETMGRFGQPGGTGGYAPPYSGAQAYGFVPAATGPQAYGFTPPGLPGWNWATPGQGEPTSRPEHQGGAGVNYQGGAPGWYNPYNVGQNWASAMGEATQRYGGNTPQGGWYNAAGQYLGQSVANAQQRANAANPTAYYYNAGDSGRKPPRHVGAGFATEKIGPSTGGREGSFGWARRQARQRKQQYAIGQAFNQQQQQQQPETLVGAGGGGDVPAWIRNMTQWRPD